MILSKISWNLLSLKFEGIVAGTKKSGTHTDFIGAFFYGNPIIMGHAHGKDVDIFMLECVPEEKEILIPRAETGRVSSTWSVAWAMTMTPRTRR